MAALPALKPRALSIREVSERSGCPASALRDYEAAGLITALPRGETAARTYDPRVLDTLHVVTALRGAGFGIREIGDFLSIKRTGEPAVERLKRVQAALGDLQAGLTKRRAALEQAGALLSAWQAEVRDAPAARACPASEAE